MTHDELKADLAMTSEPAGLMDLLRTPTFSSYFLTFSVSNVGMFMQALGVPFVLYQMTKSASWVGAAGFTAQIAAFAVTPLAGTLADRVSRRLVLIASQVIQLTAALMLWYLAEVDGLRPWRMLVILAIAGVGAGFQHTTAQALMPQVVAPEHFVASMRVFPLCFNIPRAFGPMLAGIVLHRYGIGVTFALNAASFVPFILVLATMSLRPAALAGPQEPWVQQFRSGFRYARSNRQLAGAITLVFMMALLAMSVISHVADIGSSVYGVSADGIGWMSASLGFGSIAASFAVVRMGEAVHQFLLGICGLAAQAIAVIVVVSTHSFPVGLAALFLLGFGNLMTGISMSVVLQTTTSDEYRGRVGSLYMSGYLLGNPIGALAIGFLGDAIGLRLAIAASGALLLGYAAFVGQRFRSSMKRIRLATPA